MLKPKLDQTVVTLHIDADSLVFRAAHVAAKEEEKQETKPNPLGLVEEHVNKVKQDPKVTYDAMLRDVINHCEVEYALLGMRIGEVFTYFTSSSRYSMCDGLEPNFRMDVWPQYKQCRKGMPLPEALEETFEHAACQLNALLVQGKEADDVCAWHILKDPEHNVLAALDKDLLYGLPGHHWNYGKNHMVNTSETDAIRYPFIQAVEGDRSDCYKGVPGVGEVGAGKLLNHINDETEMWKAVKGLYLEKGLTEDDAIMMMQLASMRQWNGEKLTLWTPDYLGL